MSGAGTECPECGSYSVHYQLSLGHNGCLYCGWEEKRVSDKPKKYVDVTLPAALNDGIIRRSREPLSEKGN